MMRSVFGVMLVYMFFWVIMFGACVSMLGCATPTAPPTHMAECRNLCLNGKVDSFKDELQECRCRQ